MITMYAAVMLVVLMITAFVGFRAFFVAADLKRDISHLLDLGIKLDIPYQASTDAPEV